MTVPTEALLRLPPDERAVLSFLSRQAGKRNEFVARTIDLLALLDDCSLERFGLLARRLEDRGLIERQKLNKIGTRWVIFCKLDADRRSSPFTIPQNRPNWPNVVAYRNAASLPLFSQGARVRRTRSARSSPLQ